MRCFLVALVILFSCLSASAQGWEWLNPLPQGNTLIDLDYLGQNQLYSTGYYGTSIVSANDGQSWALRNSGLQASPSEAEFISTTEGWGIIGPYSPYRGDSLTNAIVHTTDGGQTWHHQYHDSHVELHGIAWPTPQSGWVVGVFDSTYQLVILHTTNSGVNWTAQVHDSLTSNAHVFFLNEQQGWITLEHLTLRTTDAGATWQQYPTPYWMYFDLLFEDSLNGWGASFNDVFRTTDGGEHWTPQHLAIVNNEWTRSVAVADENNIWVVTGSGAAFSTTNRGQTWTRRVITNTSLDKVLFSGVQHGWICGDDGVVYQTTDAGATWTLRAGNTFVDGAYSFAAVTFADLQNGWIVSMNWDAAALILHTTNGGTEWTTQYVDSLNSFIDIEAVSATNIWAVGSHVIHTTDGGQQWNIVDIGVDGGLQKIICVGDQVIWIASGWNYPVRVHRSTDGGVTWATREVEYACKFSDMAASDANNIWITSWTDLDYCAISHSSDGGETWKEQADTLGIAGPICFVDADHGWASSYPQLIRTSDGGDTWTPAGLEGMWGVSRIQFLDAQNGWVAGYDAYRTTNGGTTWQRFSPVVETPLTDIDFLDMEHGWACSWGGTLVRFDASNVAAPDHPATPPQKFILYPAYPNPFNATTTLSFELSRTGRARIELFDITGRLVQMVSDRVYSAGRHTLHVDAAGLPSGLYFARASSGSWRSVQKLVLLK